MEIRPIEPADEPALLRFFERMPEADRTFLKEDVDDPQVVAAWAKPGTARAIAVEGEEVIGSVAVVPFTAGPATSESSGSWSTRHIAARASARHAGAAGGDRRARPSGLAKLVVEVIADQEALVGMFRGARIRTGGAPHRPRAGQDGECCATSWCSRMTSTRSSPRWRRPE